MKIRSIGAALPERIVTNEELSGLLDTTDEWITERVGVKSRHVCTTETNVSLAVRAAFQALERSGLEAGELDYIITATVSADDSSPCTSAMVQKAIGASCPAFDISAACSGFLFLLDTAEAFLSRPGVNTILLIASERMSRLVDWLDRSQAVIFGDGAAALVVTKGDDLIGLKVSTFGGDEVIKIPNFAGNSPFFTGQNPHPFIYMNGQETYKFAVNVFVKDVKEIIEITNIPKDKIRYVIAHQANSRIIEAAARRIDLPREKFVMTIDHHGNTSSASIPLAMNELYEKGELEHGDHLVIAAFGGGLSSAAGLIKF